MANIYDVAREANVSIATVSKVINNNGRISDKTRQRVLGIMKALNYQPSLVASALTGKGTYTIGLLIPDLANPFFAEAARSIEDRAQELGFSVVMCNTDFDQSREAKYVSLLKQKQVDGLIFASGFYDDKYLRELQEEKTPMAMFSQEIPELDINTVSVDDRKGGYLATKHLLELGHRKIGVMAQYPPNYPDRIWWGSAARIEGYRAALEEAGVEFNQKLIWTSAPSINDAQIVAGQILDSPQRLTAIFACNDLQAIGTIKAARERGIKIPDDLSVLGYDDTLLATIVDPPLTTVGHPIQEMGRKVVDILVETIEGKLEQTQSVILLPELRIRNSTMPPKYK